LSRKIVLLNQKNTNLRQTSYNIDRFHRHTLPITNPHLPI
jgi:hypothetical protein